MSERPLHSVTRFKYVNKDLALDITHGLIKPHFSKA